MTQEASEPVAAVTLAAIVDGAAEQAEHEYEIARRLREELNVRSYHDERDGALSDQAFWTFLAYEYHLSGPNPAELAYFQPPLLYADGSGNIPQLSSLTDEAVEWLEELSTGLKHPRARARLEHLLFLRRSGKPGEHARAAIES
jgi:hypothetical protein